MRDMFGNERWIQVMCLSVLLLFISCTESPTIDRDAGKQISKKEETVLIKKKVLYVNSYHSGYDWSDGIAEGILETFGARINDNGKIDNSTSKVVLKIVDMDTKRNKSEEFKKTAALKVKELIDSWKPDLVITSDDNASKYLIVPYFKKTDIPFVFCGVNWDASEYGFPTDNVTGMIEVQLIIQILDTLRKYAGGDRIAFIKGDDISARKESEYFEKRFNIKLDKRFVKDFSGWQQEYKRLQTESDMILVGNAASISDWHPEQAISLIETFTSVPTGNWDAWMAPYSLITYATKPKEQGEWAAKTAIEILNGKKPGDIPVVTNHKAKIYLNMHLAKKLDIIFSIDLMEQATFTEERKISD